MKHEKSRASVSKAIRGNKSKANSVNIQNESDAMIEDDDPTEAHANSLGHINISSPKSKKGSKQINTSVG